MTRPTVLVTGAARRIGAAIARHFGAAGWHVIVHYGRSGNAAEALIDELPSAQSVQCDLRDNEAIKGMVQRLAADHSDWRALINCASVFEYDDADALDPAMFDRAMQVNALAPAILAQSFLTHARSQSGRRIIQVTDQKLANTNPDFFSYTMSKHAHAATIGMLTKHHLGSQDRIYGLAPGAILPSHDQSADEIEDSHILNLLERQTGVSEIADAAVFLAEGPMQSGQTLFIDSGQHLLSQPRDVIYLARQGENA